MFRESFRFSPFETTNEPIFRTPRSLLAPLATARLGGSGDDARPRIQDRCVLRQTVPQEPRSIVDRGKCRWVLLEDELKEAEQLEMRLTDKSAMSRRP